MTLEEYLSGWTVKFVKHMDIMKRSILDIKTNKNIIIVEKKDIKEILAQKRVKSIWSKKVPLQNR